jgi:hypothetical protein
MALWQRVMRFLWGPAVDRYEEAFHITDEVAAEARELKARLEPYERERDPFNALMVDLYNRREEVMWNRSHQASVR